MQFRRNVPFICTYFNLYSYNIYILVCEIIIIFMRLVLYMVLYILLCCLWMLSVSIIMNFWIAKIIYNKQSWNSIIRLWKTIIEVRWLWVYECYLFFIIMTFQSLVMEFKSAFCIWLFCNLPVMKFQDCFLYIIFETDCYNEKSLRILVFWLPP